MKKEKATTKKSKKKNPKNAGRKSSITIKNGTDFNEKVLQKLEESFSRGMNNTEACLRADISESIFYKVLEVNISRENRFKLLQNNLKMKTKELISDSIISKKDLDTAKWYAERKMKDEFSTRQETDLTSNGETVGVAFLPPKKDE